MKILLAEDDGVTRSMLEALLTKWRYRVLVAANGAEAWDLLQRDDSPRLAILDWMMPGMDGVFICQEVRKLESKPYIYIILLTGRGRKEDVIAGLQAGADDYLTKPFDPYELKARLRTGERIVELQRQLIAAREALREQATHDPLTGLLNHAACLEIFQQELIRCRRERKTVGVVMADIDHFKHINDTFGHLVGDVVLREVARRLRASMRAYDGVGRYGGEEFLIVLPGCDAARALAQAERVRLEISALPVEIPDKPLTITLSLGVATSESPSHTDMEGLIAAADKALYRAKEGGRNRTELATSLIRSSPETSA